MGIQYCHTFLSNMKLTLSLLACTLAVASAFPYPYPYPQLPGKLTIDQQLERDAIVYLDQNVEGDTHQPSYHQAPVGRVKIQTYRGPSKGKGYDVFAPWGYYNTQPADAPAYGHH